jgi:uncharacterized membrane protein YgcG
VPDLAASRIIDEAITPRFRNNDFAGGLNAAVTSSSAWSSGEPLPEPRATAAAPAASDGLRLGDLAIFLFVAVPIGAPIARRPGQASSARWSPAAASAWWRGFSPPACIVAAIAGLVALVFSLFASLGGGAAARGGRRRWRPEQRRRAAVAAGGGGGGRAAAVSAPAAVAISAAAAPRGTGEHDGNDFFSKLGRIWRHAGSTSADSAAPARRRDGAPHAPRGGQRAAPQRRDPHLRRGRPADVLPVALDMRRLRERAVTLFGKLRVWDTEHNNGVLIYLLLAEHAIEIVADRGIDAHVDDAEWAAMVQRMGSAFREGRFEDGLTQALEEMSACWWSTFRWARRADVNELPDEPVVL